MPLTPDDIEKLALALKGGQDRTNSGILGHCSKDSVSCVSPACLV
jgi:hypothetical protein